MDIGKLFNDEVRDKKRTASGVHSKTGKRGYTGKIMFASDLLRGKEKRDYIKSSKVEVFNVYDTILGYQDFLLLDNEERVKHLEEYTKRFTVNELAEAWGVTYKNAYQQFTRAKVSIVKKAPRGQHGGRRKATTNVVEPKQEQESLPIPPTAEQKVIEVPVPVKPNGFSFTYNGEYTAEQISNKLEKIGLLLSDEEGQRYKVEITVSELED
jgi:hypothetical protein